MRYAVDRRQITLFDPGEKMFSPMALKFLRSDWPGLFRSQMLVLMPARELGEHFHPSQGAPTKELYSMAGLIFLKEYFNLTIEQTIERYLVDGAWQYALNVNPMMVSLGHATLERYIRLFATDRLAQEVFHRVTSAFIEILELDISRQRLDSTHIFSDMALFGRTRLMGVTIKRFLTQLKRQHRELYLALPEALRQRYQPSAAQLFGDHPGPRERLRQSVAEDLLFLVAQFAQDAMVSGRSSFKAMRRVLFEQCEAKEGRFGVKAQTGCQVMQNPSDPEATYDGHKGPGYQAQISETCSSENDVQLITGVMVEPANCCDQDAVEPMLDVLEAHGRKPELLVADAGYGSDANAARAEQRGVDLQSPVGGSPVEQGDDALSIDDFAVDEKTETVECCPNGCAPVSSEYDPRRDETTTVMAATDCSSCEFQEDCPVKKVDDGYVLKHTPSKRRLAGRRAEQKTEPFKETYAVRAGGESVNSGLKRKTGMGRLRIRGRPKVTMAVLLRCAGWNLFRALTALKKRGRAAFGACCAMFLAFLQRLSRSECPPIALIATPGPYFRPLRPLNPPAASSNPNF